MLKIGWYKFVFLAGLLVATMIVVGVNLSDYATPYAEFVKNQIFIVWGMVLLEWVVHHTTGISIFPFGSHDPDTYILQKYLGYNGAVAVAIGAGLILSGFFAWTILAYNITWMPVSHMLAPGLGVVSRWSMAFFSGGSPFFRAFIDGFVPTFFENPLLIYSTVFLLWIIPRYTIYRPLGNDYANIAGLITWLIFAGLIFSYAYHSFVYQGIEAAYTRAYFFVLINGVFVGLTGIPFPMDISHFSNNFFASYFKIVSWGVIMTPMFVYFNRSKFGNWKEKIMKIRGLKK